MRIFIICTTRVINSKRIRWAGHVARMGETPEGKPGRRWEDDIKKDLKEVG
jgi:Icc-related predicted phosphoesterase